MSLSTGRRDVVTWLVPAITVLAIGAAAGGLFSSGVASTRSVTSLRGDEVELYGRGLYEHDTLFIGAGNRGTDATVLLVGVPLLLVATALHRRGSLRGTLLLLGVLGFFLYVYVTYSVGVAFNSLFVAYVAIASASLFAFIRTFAALDVHELGGRMSADIPRHALGWFMIVSGVVTAGIWLPPLLGVLLDGTAPLRLGTYTTSVTDAIDLGVITPAVLLSGWLILGGDARGYAIAMSLLVLEASLAPLIVAQTLFQLDAGVEFTTAEIVGPIAGFVTISVAALCALVTILRKVEEPRVKATTSPASAARPAPSS